MNSQPSEQVVTFEFRPLFGAAMAVGETVELKAGPLQPHDDPPVHILYDGLVIGVVPYPAALTINHWIGLRTLAGVVTGRGAGTLIVSVDIQQ